MASVTAVRVGWAVDALVHLLIVWDVGACLYVFHSMCTWVGVGACLAECLCVCVYGVVVACGYVCTGTCACMVAKPAVHVRTLSH